jgi:DNA-binding SARP family transcriptional activator
MGPLELHNGEDWVGLSAARWRTVLALLIINRNRTVSVDQLIDELWGADLPNGPVKAVQVYVSRVRQTLNDKMQKRLFSTASGYQLSFDPAELDANIFEDLIRRGRSELASRRPQAAAAILRRAFSFYRGPVLVGVPGTSRICAEAARLEEMRLSALQDYLDARCLLGETCELIAELRALTSEYPLHEGFWARLMLALGQAGRQADALEVYSRARGLLVGQLGVEPGCELRQAHQRILNAWRDGGGWPGRDWPERDARRSRPAAAVTPRQLPPVASGFAGRDLELRQLDAMLDATRATRPLALSIALITGQPGVGKSSLARYWAHSMAGLFPDGQLYADFRDGDPVPGVPPGRVLRQFIGALSTAGQPPPETVEEQTALYRSLLFGKRLLVLLDNVRDAGQVRPLLPGSAECFVVVTSRYHPAGLISTDGARGLRLERLRHDEARELLSNLIGRCRVDAEPDLTQRMITECGGQPGSLRRAAALAGMPLNPV